MSIKQEIISINKQTEKIKRLAEEIYEGCGNCAKRKDCKIDNIYKCSVYEKEAL